MITVHQSRRRAGLVMAFMLVLTSCFLVFAGPAQAESCYNRGGYSFNSTSSRLTSQINVWRGSGCSGNQIGRGTTALVSDGRVQMTVWDLACDSVGMWGYVHGYSTHPGGCGETTNVRFNLSSVGTPHNWWVNVGGSSGVNSNAVNLPS